VRFRGLIGLIGLCAAVSAPADEAVDLLVRGGTVVTMDGAHRVIEDGAVAIRADRIVAVGPTTEVASRYQARATVEAAGRIVLPGLVNTHTHVPMTLFRGIADDMELMDWLQNHIWPAENRNVTPEFVTWGTRLAAWELIRSGTTTFADMYFYEDQVAAATKEAGLRAVCASTVIDFPVPGTRNADEGLAAAEAFLKKWRGDPLIVPAVGPHAPYSVSPDNLKRARALADRYGALLVIHAAESPSEMKTIRERYSLSSIAHLDRLGILGPQTLLAHAVWLSDEDIAIVKARDAGLAHCPQSNMKMAAGVAPIPRLRRAGLRVGLGTDGAASNNDLSLFEEIDTALKLQKISTGHPAAFTAREAVEMATMGGARALHMEADIGSLEAGKKADLIVISLEAPHAIPLYDVYSHLAYALKGEDVETVIVNGRTLMERGRLLTLDTAGIAAKAREIQKQVARSLSPLGRFRE
jgi:5-methylthioadenosine/S-adenosylhomocysteine deaminase